MGRRAHFLTEKTAREGSAPEKRLHQGWPCGAREKMDCPQKSGGNTERGNVQIRGGGGGGFG